MHIDVFTPPTHMHKVMQKFKYNFNSLQKFNSLVVSFTGHWVVIIGHQESLIFGYWYQLKEKEKKGHHESVIVTK